MRKIFLGILIFLIVLVGVVALAPVLFKDKIKQVLDKQLAQRVRAKVEYNPRNVSLSLLRTFPDLALSIDELRVIGQDSFARDTLAYLPSFRVGLDLMSVVRGGQIKVKSVLLDRPDISLKVLKSGRANWNVFISDSAAARQGKDTASLNVAIKGWQINDGRLRYQDLSIPFAMRASHVNHSGSGDFESNVFDMVSHTTADGFTMNYNGVDYLSDTKLDADVTMAMDLGRMLFTFKDNKVKVNDLPATFAGTIAMPAKDIDFDLKFKAVETDFKNILSVVPGMFTEKFRNIQTEGRMAFDGYFKGTYNDLKMPGYGVNLQVKNGMFKYPELPQAARNINVDMQVDNPSGFTNNVKVNVKQFHLDLGKNPVDGNVTIDGLAPMLVNGRVKANVDLAEMMKVYPVQDLILRGQLFVDGTAKGVYSKTQMPVVQAAIRMANGYVKSKKFPAPIENLTLNGTVTNTTGQPNDTRIDVPQFRMLLDGEPLEGRVAAQNIAKPSFDADVKGVVDLTKLTKIFPLQGMTVTGRLNGNVAAKGKMADIEAGRYQSVVASGTVNAQNITYKSKDLPQGMKVTRATATFNNDQIVIRDMAGFVGSSDIAANGVISNYMGYLFTPGQPLRGNLTVNSSRFNVNEWMVDNVSARPTATATSRAPAKASGVLQIPKFFDLTLNSSAGQVLYDNLNLQNVKGTVVVRDETVKLNDVTFNTLGGAFATNGSYSSKNLQHPKFDFGLNIKNLNFQNAFQAFNSIKVLVPLASEVEGVFSTNFSVSGEMGQNMLPNYGTLTGKGVFEVVRAAVLNSPVMNKISALTQLQELKKFAVENKDVAAEILNGNFIVKPFDLNIGQIKMTVGGSNNVNGNLTYVTALNVPTGRLGNQLNSQLTRLTGVQNLQGTDRVTLGLNIGGTMADPQVRLTSGSVKSQAKDLISNIVQSKLTDAKNQLLARSKLNKDSIQGDAQRKEEDVALKGQQELEKRRLEAEAKLRQKATQGLNNILFGKPKPQPTPKAEAPQPEAPKTPAPAKPDSTKSGQ